MSNYSPQAANVQDAIQSISATGNISAWNSIVTIGDTPLTANIILTLPTAVGNLGKTIKFIRIDSAAFTVTLAGQAGETITTFNGGIELNTQTGSLTLEAITATAILQQNNNGNAYKAPTIQRITATGTYTRPAGLKHAIIELIGGGGAGGGAQATTGVQASVGSGGAGGGYVKFLATAAQIGASQSVTIGAGGVGASGANGGNGGTTLFGALASAAGGTGGGISALGTTSAQSAVNTSGGVGVVTTGTLIQSSTGGIGGASAAQSPTSSDGVFLGQGGSTPITNLTPAVFAVNAAGVSQSGISGFTSFSGCGGSGSGNSGATFAAKTGAAGIIGICIVQEFY
jgi:hypothetical protein